MRTRIKLWSAAVLACLAALVGAALLLRQSFALTAFSDVIQCILLLSGTLSFLARVGHAEGRMRLFWSLMTLGLALWLSYQVLWTYIEVLQRAAVPDLFSGDLVLFVHIVPLIAAVALRPHFPRDQYAARLGHLDFALLFVWWVYLYVLLVMAWQYATPDPDHYGSNLNAVYLAEKLFFLAALAACWAGSKGCWRTFYANLFGASLLYATSSYSANWALNQRVYYSGSVYDIPLAASMAWITLIGLWTRTEEPETPAVGSSTAYGVWVARCTMIAVFSLPLFGAWALSDAALPAPVRSFRLVLTLAAALVMGVMVLTRQRLLDRELNRLLSQSCESFANLKRLQAQILQSEKVASIGQLVGGAAHELNNPLTAMLGYSELLLGTQLNPEQLTLAAQISQHARQTKSLVANLLSFAKRTPAAQSPVDLNMLVRTAVRLTQPQWQTLKVEVTTDLRSDLPKVLGDSNQLLQVCLQILGTALHSAHERGGGQLTLTTQAVAGSCVLTVGEGLAPVQNVEPIAAPADQADPLALTPCRGIVQDHQGGIWSSRSADGSYAVRMELPALDPAPRKSAVAQTSPRWLISN